MSRSSVVVFGEDVSALMAPYDATRVMEPTLLEPKQWDESTELLKVLENYSYRRTDLLNTAHLYRSPKEFLLSLTTKQIRSILRHGSTRRSLTISYNPVTKSFSAHTEKNMNGKWTEYAVGGRHSNAFPIRKDADSLDYLVSDPKDSFRIYRDAATHATIARKRALCWDMLKEIGERHGTALWEQFEEATRGLTPPPAHTFADRYDDLAYARFVWDVSEPWNRAVKSLGSFSSEDFQSFLIEGGKQDFLKMVTMYYFLSLHTYILDPALGGTGEWRSDLLNPQADIADQKFRTTKDWNLELWDVFENLPPEAKITILDVIH